MLPTLALVGRPNVGKSTLFNRLTASRAALVADFPGLTRDRQYGRGRVGSRAFIVVDTGGFEPQARQGIMRSVADQTRTAIAEADAVIFLTDGRDGLTGEDRTIADLLRRSGRPVVVAVNKTEGLEAATAVAEFHELGLGRPIAVSSAHGGGVGALLDAALALCPREIQPEERDAREDRVRVAIVGRPNVGKSTLVNALLGEERVIAFGEPGTTRDALYLDFARGGRAYTVIDTAGVRRRGKVFEAIEKFSVVKTLQAIEDAHVVVLMLDAEQGVGEQDARIAAHILEAGRALVVAVNKWDAADAAGRAAVKHELDRRLGFLDFAERLTMSAREGRGVAALLSAVDRAYAAATARLPTPRLTRTLQEALVRQQPARAGLSRPKLRYAHQGGVNPPVIVIHGNALAGVSDSYRRYLEHFFRQAFQLQGTPLRIQFKAGANPYAESATRRRKRR
ncbi:MAG TPA: ribosome biogenesis GTPase Der [Casimicrobiaceae bacterium]|nr:ribosome biogenesis GTPase Der [Casimicrobiaceae bacterium]